MSNRLWTCLFFVLLAIAFLLSGCNTSFAQEHLTSAAANTENEILAGTDGEMQEDGHQANSNLENLEDSPYLTLFNETIEQIKDEMMPFAFKAYYREETDDFISDLQIVNTQTNVSVGDFYLIDYMLHWDIPKGIPDKFYKLELIDVDFDGYKDIRIFAGPNGNWNKDYLYFIWDSDASKFMDDKYGLRGLGLPGFDEEKQLVYSMVRASAVDHWYYTHQYIEGELVTIEEIADNGVRGLYRDELAKEQISALEPLFDEDRTNFTQFIKKQLDIETMEMVVVEFKFVLYDVPDACILAEYAPESAVGLLLAQYETSADIN